MEFVEKKIVSQKGQEEKVSENIIRRSGCSRNFQRIFLSLLCPNLKRFTDHGHDNDLIATDDQVTNAVNKFTNHPSIIIIKNKKIMFKVFLLVP